MQKIKNPKCPKCERVYNPRTFNTERTMLVDGKTVRQWHCDCEHWVNLDTCEWV